VLVQINIAKDTALYVLFFEGWSTFSLNRLKYQKVILSEYGEPVAEVFSFFCPDGRLDVQS